jgi:lysyl-tRNA synthetase class II
MGGRGFIEVETSVLVPEAGGAARALRHAPQRVDEDRFLRIALGCTQAADHRL